MTEGEYHPSYLLLQTIDSEGGIEEEATEKEELLSQYGITILGWKCQEPIRKNL